MEELHAAIIAADHVTAQACRAELAEINDDGAGLLAQSALWAPLNPPPAPKVKESASAA